MVARGAVCEAFPEQEPGRLGSHETFGRSQSPLTTTTPGRGRRAGRSVPEPAVEVSTRRAMRSPRTQHDKRGGSCGGHASEVLCHPCLLARSVSRATARTVALASRRTGSVRSVRRHDFLKQLHDRVQPRTYVETGIDRGQSMTLSRAPSIGIDPEYSITCEVLADVHLARTTSDEFFAREDPLAHLPRKIVDLAFVDGMHLAEYALRDYLAVERFTEPTSVIVFDDMLPRNADEAARYRHTGPWTGDVYKAAQALRDMCPELIVLDVDTAPTGAVVVLAPNASRNGELPGYDDWLDIAVTPDPQDVPAEVYSRSRALNPQRLLGSTGWAQLIRLRERGSASVEDMRAAFADVLTGDAGRAPVAARTS